MQVELDDPGDVTKLLGSLFGSAAARPVDLLVNNAGLGHVGEVASETDEQVERMVNVTVTALVRLTPRP